jgi:Cu/Ag efflux protein CusF
MKRHLPIILAATVACTMFTDVRAMVAATDISASRTAFFSQTGEIKQIDTAGNKLVVDTTTYIFPVAQVKFHQQDNAITNVKALQSGMRIGFNTQKNSATGKEQITEIWLLDAASSRSGKNK